MKMTLKLLLALTTTLFFAGCGGSDHDHDHDDHDHGDEHSGGDGHSDEHADAKDLPDATIGAMTLKLKQAGAIEAGKEAVLLVKLSESDKGQTIVRAWIGSDDRTLSRISKGEFVAKDTEYHLHVRAPKPLPEGAMWWIEIEKPDGTKSVGSVAPLTGS